MKKYILLLLTLNTLNLTLFSQTITNIWVNQRTDGSGLADITFTLSGTATTYYIAAEASFDGGNTFSPIPAGSLTGDTGPISPGAGKHIIWNGLQSFPNTYSTQAKVKLFVSTTPPAGQPCPGTPTVVYGGQTYNTVQIGTQCWLKENLNIGTKIPGSQDQANTGTIEKYCYNNDEANCAIYGGLYQWNELMQYVTTPGVQGICPPGWHVPTDAEWCTITQFIDPTVNCGVLSWSGTDAGLKMKSTSGWYNNGNGTNSSGFTALPGGFRGNNGSFGNLTYYAYFWSSSESSSSGAWRRYLDYYSEGVARSYISRTGGFSGRCLKD